MYSLGECVDQYDILCARGNGSPAQTALLSSNNVVIGVANLESKTQLVSTGSRRKHEHGCKCGSGRTGRLTTEYSIDKSRTPADTYICIQIQE